MVLANTLRVVSSTGSTQIPKKVDGRMAAVVAQLVKQCMQKEKDVVSARTCGKLSFCPFLFAFSILFLHVN